MGADHWTHRLEAEMALHEDYIDTLDVPAADLY